MDGTVDEKHRDELPWHVKLMLLLSVLVVVFVLSIDLLGMASYI